MKKKKADPNDLGRRLTQALGINLNDPVIGWTLHVNCNELPILEIRTLVRGQHIESLADAIDEERSFKWVPYEEDDD